MENIDKVVDLTCSDSEQDDNHCSDSEQENNCSDSEQDDNRSSDSEQDDNQTETIEINWRISPDGKLVVKMPQENFEVTEHGGILLTKTNCENLLVHFNKNPEVSALEILPPVTKKRKRKSQEEENVASEEEKNILDVKKTILSLQKKQGVLLRANGKAELVESGQFDLKHIYSLVNCKSVQMVPCTVGEYKNAYQLYMNEVGAFHDELNEFAMLHLKDQLHGGKVYGNILVVKNNTVS